MTTTRLILPAALLLALFTGLLTGCEKHIKEARLPGHATPSARL